MERITTTSALTNATAGQIRNARWVKLLLSSRTRIKSFYKIKKYLSPQTTGSLLWATCISPFSSGGFRVLNYPKWAKLVLDRACLWLQLLELDFPCVCNYCLKHFKFSRCGRIPLGCQRCDDVCAQRDGKQGRDDYKKKKQVQPSHPYLFNFCFIWQTGTSYAAEGSKVFLRMPRLAKWEMQGDCSEQNLEWKLSFWFQKPPLADKKRWQRWLVGELHCTLQTRNQDH